MSSTATPPYLGPWLDSSSGLLHGSRITTTSTTAFCLVSFLAIFILAFGRHFWGILRFILHQLRVVRSPQDGLYYQEQVLLRNASSPSMALWEFLRVGWAWRGRAEYSLARVAPLILLAMAQVVVFTLAGVFSSGTFSVTNEVLVQSEEGACGYLNWPESTPGDVLNTTDWSLLNSAFIEDRTAATKSLAYRSSCYGESAGSDCNYYVKPRIESTNMTVACPFAEVMCLKSDGTGALQVTSEVDTIEDLGINSKRDTALTYKKVTTCAPLVTDGYSRWYQNTAGQDQYLEFFYGSYINLASAEQLPVTFAYDAFSSNYTATAYPVNYQLSTWNNSATSTFTPIPSISRPDGDITLIFVFNNAKYTAPVTDLFFNATVAKPDVYGVGGEFMYQASSPVAVMGCLEQHQFCTSSYPSAGSCTPLTGFAGINQTGDATYSGSLKPGMTAAQTAIANVLRNSIAGTLLSDMIFNLGSSSLLATASVDGASTLLSAPLPPTQWISEIVAWHNYALAHLQRLVVGVAAGPSKKSSVAYIVPPSEGDRRAFDICTGVKVLDPRYYTFSVSGLTIILIVGILTILTNIFLPRLVGIAQGLLGHGLHRREDWHHDHVLQLQRMAFEGGKLGQWSARGGGVPTTLQSLTGQRFVRPGRVEKAYEPLELAERGAGGPVRAGEEERERKGGFRGVPSVEVTGSPDTPKSAYYHDDEVGENEDPFADQDEAEKDMGGLHALQHNDGRESYDMGARGLGLNVPGGSDTGYSARPSVDADEAYYGARPGSGSGSGSSAGTKSREFL